MQNQAKTLALFAALVLTIACIPAWAGQTDGTDPKEPDKFDALVKQIGELRKTVEEMDRKLKTYVDNAVFSSDGRWLKTEMDTVDLKKQLAQLQKDLDAINNKLNSVQTRVSLYQPPAQQPTTGRVRLVNTFPEQMTVLVNERAYRLAPGATQLTEALPAGNFNYQVLGVQNDQQVRLLTAGETFTITIHPR